MVGVNCAMVGVYMLRREILPVIMSALNSRLSANK